MAGWHTRVWRRVRVAPGVSVNFSKSGPSLSVGPRGAKVTFGRRGVRQTLGVPGTGVYMTRQLSSSESAVAIPPAPSRPLPVAKGATPVAGPATAQSAEGGGVTIFFGLVTIAGIVFWAVSSWLGAAGSAPVVAGILAIVAGLVYEAFAHDHPHAAKLVAQVIVGLVALATVIGAVVVIGVLAGGLSGTSGSRRRRRS